MLNLLSTLRSGLLDGPIDHSLPEHRRRIQEFPVAQQIVAGIFVSVPLVPFVFLAVVVLESVPSAAVLASSLTFFSLLLSIVLSVAGVGRGLVFRSLFVSGLAGFLTLFLALLFPATYFLGYGWGSLCFVVSCGAVYWAVTTFSEQPDQPSGHSHEHHHEEQKSRVE
eukprot:gnl/Spiro4/24783_TR12323_c0_g1_i1.p1 gnl/Spiro4/24783_TR12323_c0_g1~~gnl/Spiro4/24783_TR12323_c0_g1_i1.p1  ORF type:complete len:167 (-),score=23.72 gnl/Spiro4/24783_TR12323_c0_g1_i1:47-547(-)